MLLQTAAALASLWSLAAATCYNRNGSYASSYQPCPNSQFCCKPTGQCTDTGLCLDPNNNVNGSLAIVGGNPQNQTGLFQTAACTNANWDGCLPQCLSLTDNGFHYLWSCNDAQTDYCCLAPKANVFAHRGCCNNVTFTLTSPVVVAWPVAAAAGSSSTTSSVAVSASTSSASTFSSSATSATSSAGASAVAAASASSGLSTGASAGIGIGVAVGVILVAAVAFLLFRMKRLRARLAGGGGGGARPVPSYYEAVNSSHGDAVGDVKGFASPAVTAYQLEPIKGGAQEVSAHNDRHAYTHLPLAEADGNPTYELSRNNEPRELP